MWTPLRWIICAWKSSNKSTKNPRKSKNSTNFNRTKQCGTTRKTAYLKGFWWVTKRNEIAKSTPLGSTKTLKNRLTKRFLFFYPRKIHELFNIIQNLQCSFLFSWVEVRVNLPCHLHVRMSKPASNLLNVDTLVSE